MVLCSLFPPSAFGVSSGNTVTVWSLIFCSLELNTVRNKQCCAELLILIIWLNILYRDADKSLARLGRKQATATKLLLWKPLKRKKNSEGCPSNQVSAAAMTSASDVKWRPFNCFFSRVGLRTYQHPYIPEEFGFISRRL